MTRMALLPFLQVKSQDVFDAWVVKLRHHRLYRQNEIVRSPRDATIRTFPPPSANLESPQAAPAPVHEVKVGRTLRAFSCIQTCVPFHLMQSLTKENL